MSEATQQTHDQEERSGGGGCLKNGRLRLADLGRYRLGWRYLLGDELAKFDANGLALAWSS